MSGPKRLKALEDKDRNLKRMLVEQLLGNATLKGMLINMAPTTRRIAVGWAIEQ